MCKEGGDYCDNVTRKIQENSRVPLDHGHKRCHLFGSQPRIQMEVFERDR
jgi:hypothetical protein